MTNIVSGVKASGGMSLSAPTSSTTVGSHLRMLVENNSLTGDDKGDLSMAVPTTSTRSNFTSIGRFKDSSGNNEFGSLWRMRVSVNLESIDATLSAYKNTFSEDYQLLGGYDTFAISPKFTGSATHILRAPGFKKTKAAGNQDAATASPSIDNTDDYLIIGSDFDDVLTGADGNDVLGGGLGSDTLTGADGDDFLVGGLGSDDLTGSVDADIFAYNLGDVADASTETDTIQDFDSTEMDRIGLGTGLTFGSNVFADTTTQTGDTLIRLNNATTGDIIAEVVSETLGAGDFVNIGIN
jgi:Ca2+-binding RTX toxin-like protein